MLRTTLIFCAMFMAVGTANAEPLKLTDTQMDTVRAGAGLKFKNDNAPEPMSGIPPWNALFAAGFGADTVELGDPSGIILLLPR